MTLQQLAIRAAKHESGAQAIQEVYKKDHPVTPLGEASPLETAAVSVEATEATRNNTANERRTLQKSGKKYASANNIGIGMEEQESRNSVLNEKKGVTENI